jgi:hypothetical protein
MKRSDPDVQHKRMYHRDGAVCLYCGYPPLGLTLTFNTRDCTAKTELCSCTVGTLLFLISEFCFSLQKGQFTFKFTIDSKFDSTELFAGMNSYHQNIIHRRMKCLFQEGIQYVWIAVPAHIIPACHREMRSM